MGALLTRLCWSIESKPLYKKPREACIDMHVPTVGIFCRLRFPDKHFEVSFEKVLITTEGALKAFLKNLHTEEAPRASQDEVKHLVALLYKFSDSIYKSLCKANLQSVMPLKCALWFASHSYLSDDRVQLSRSRYLQSRMYTGRLTGCLFEAIIVTCKTLHSYTVSLTKLSQQLFRESKAQETCGQKGRP